MKKFLREFLVEIIIVIVFIVVWFTAIQTREVFQTSMEPNFSEGERVIIFKAAYWSWVGQPRRGDVIIINAPDPSDGVFIKRVIGVPGDEVEIVNGATYVNGVKLDEPYVKRPFTYSYPKTVIPDGTYFVLGDNRDISNDSHRFGPLPRANIIGRVFIVYWPPSHWDWVSGYPLGKQLTAAQ